MTELAVDSSLYDLPEYLQRDIREQGLSKETFDKLKCEMEEWQNVKLNIAVVGQARQGKSSLINTMCGLKWNAKEGAAVSAQGETTYDLRSYTHQKNANVIIWDCPGIDGTDFKRDFYFEKIEAEEKKYDFYLIVTADIFSGDALFLAKKIPREFGKRFYLVRTKIDQSVRDIMEDERPDLEEEACAKIIKGRIQENLEKSDFSADKFKVFVLSNKEPRKFDFDELQSDICEESTSQLIREAYLFTITAKGPKINKLKYDMLLNRSYRIAMLSISDAEVRIPGTIYDLDLHTYVNAAITFLVVFGLDKADIAAREKTLHLKSGDMESQLDNYIREESEILHLVRNKVEIDYNLLFNRELFSRAIREFIGSEKGAILRLIADKCPKKSLIADKCRSSQFSLLFEFFRDKAQSYAVTMFLLKVVLDASKKAADYMCEMKIKHL